MKTEYGKYTIYNNSNRAITVVNNETDHFITAVLQSGIIIFYSDTTIGNFSESINIDATSRVVFFNDEFIVKSDSPKYEITYSFANHSEKYDRMITEFNNCNEINKENSKISIADYECKMSPQTIRYTKNREIYVYGMLDLLIQKENDQYYLVANLNKDKQSFNGRVIISPDKVNKLRQIFAFPSVSVTEGDDDLIVEIGIFKCENINDYADKYAQSKCINDIVFTNSVADKVADKFEHNFVEIKLDSVPIRIYY